MKQINKNQRTSTNSVFIDFITSKRENINHYNKAIKKANFRKAHVINFRVHKKRNNKLLVCGFVSKNINSV